MSAGRKIAPSSGNRRRPLGGLVAYYGVEERKFLASLIQDIDQPVLEIGAGACACLTRVLAGRGLRILAIDRDKNAVKTAHRRIRAAGEGDQVVLAQADAARLPFRSRSIRTAVAYNALHHADALRASVAEIARVLHPEGRLIISDWDEARDGYLNRLRRALRARFRRVTVLPRLGRRVYVGEQPGGSTRTARRPVTPQPLDRAAA